MPPVPSVLLRPRHRRRPDRSDCLPGWMCRLLRKDATVQRQLLLPVPSIILAGSPPVSDCAAELFRSGKWPCSVQRLQFPPNPYPSTCWMVQRLTSRSLASSRWLTPFDRSIWMYSRCCSLRLGRRPGKRPSARAFAWPATERSLIEFRHHSLKASTIASWSLPVAVEVSKSSARDQNSTPRQVQALDHLQPVGQPPGEPVDVGDHQSVPLDHQVQQFQEAATVVLGPAGLLGPDVAHCAAGADQPLHLQVQILVLRLSDRDPGITVQRHPSAPLAGITEVWLSARGVATGFPSHPFSYGQGQLTAMAVNRAVSSHDGRVASGRVRGIRGP